MRVRKPPSLRNNNGVIQLRVRVDGQDRFINRLGRFQDPVAVARAQTLSAQIWQDYQDRSFDPTLAKYQPIVPGTADPTLVGALREMADRTGYPRVIHAQRLVERYGKPLRTAPQVLEFVRWMEMQGLSPTTRVGILSACRKVQPTNEALRVAGLKVSHRSIEYEVLSRTEVLQVLADLKRNDPWFHPIFAFWLGTGLRNSELIGMTWDCIRWEQQELLVMKTLKRIRTNTTARQWAPTKTGQHRVVPLSDPVLEVLMEHQVAMQQQRLYRSDGLVFLTPRTHDFLYDNLLIAVWKRSLKRCGIRYRRLYSQRHTFLSHTLAAGNSPADVAAVAGHRIETLLSTYAKPTGSLKVVEWAS